MSKCINCGSELPEGAVFCTSCGAQQPPAQQYSQPNQQNGGYAQPGQNGQQYGYSQPQPQPEVFSNDADARDASDNKAIAVIGYFGLLFLVPLLAAPQSKFARFHANQSLILFIVCTISSVVLTIPFVGWLAGAVAEVFCLVCFILGIVNAAKGEYKELPLIGKYRIIK